MNWDEIESKLMTAFDQIKGNKTENAITEMLIQAGAHSAALTPVDTSFLLNSQGYEVAASGNGVSGVLYYGAKYAPWVHEMPGTLKGQPRAHFGQTGNQSEFGPQQVVSFGGGTGVGNYWDPNAEPQFLAKGVQQMIDSDLQEIIQRNYEF